MTKPLVAVEDRASFHLSPDFLDLWRDFDVPMTSTGLITMLRTYSGVKDDGTLETWFDITKRVVEGAWSIYLYHCKRYKEKPDMAWADKWARRMFEAMMRLEWCPAGRGLQHMGHDRMWIKGGALLNSCAFVSTADDTHANWVYFLADMSMLGVGVGFDTRGAGIPLGTPALVDQTYVVKDTREGWATVLADVVSRYTGELRLAGLPAVIDFHAVRPKGAFLVTMGGISSGPGPLIDAVRRILRVLDPDMEVVLSDDGLCLHLSRPDGSHLPHSHLTAEQILDIGNAVGVCVVSGGIRRSAEICLFDSRPSSEETAFSAKQDQEKLMEYRWASNNSIIVSDHKDKEFFVKVLESCKTFGDPGLLFDTNLRGFGRVGEENTREVLAAGTNPCGEQILESYELCNLVETVPGRGDHALTAMGAFLYGKLVSLLPIHHPIAQRVVARNRRVGVSLTGWIQFAHPRRGSRSEDELRIVLDNSYHAIQALDRTVSGQKLVAVNRSIKTTSVKPSGSVSLVLGTSPGMNAHFAPHYIRRINIENTSPLLHMLQADGFHAEPNIYSPTSHVVEFPCETESRTDFSAIDQLETVKLLQHKWSDNMVSNTIVFDDHEVDEVAQWVYENQGWLRSLSFLRRQHSFAQAPLEEITPEEYDRRVQDIQPPDIQAYSRAGARAHDTDSEDKWCDGGRCTIPFMDEESVEEEQGPA